MPLVTVFGGSGFLRRSIVAEAAMASADAVANAVTLYVETVDATFQAIHLDVRGRWR